MSEFVYFSMCFEEPPSRLQGMVAMNGQRDAQRCPGNTMYLDSSCYEDTAVERDISRSIRDVCDHVLLLYIQSVLHLVVTLRVMDELVYIYW